MFTPNFSEAEAGAAVEKLRALHARAMECLARCLLEPPEHSIAHRCLTISPFRSHLETAFSQANISAMGVADHVLGFCRLVAAPPLTFSPWTCVRAGIESAARVVWLMDRRLDDRSRLERSFTIRHEGFTKQLTLLNSVGDSSAAGQVRTRMSRLEQLADSIGISRKTDKNRRTIGYGQAMPQATQLIHDTLEQGLAYRLLSGIAHGQNWATLQACFEPFQLPEGTADNIREFAGAATLMKQTLKPFFMAYLSFDSAIALARAAGEFCAVFGVDHTAVDNQLMQLMSEMEPKLRPWIPGSTQPSEPSE